MGKDEKNEDSVQGQKYIHTSNLHSRLEKLLLNLNVYSFVKCLLFLMLFHSIPKRNSDRICSYFKV